PPGAELDVIANRKEEGEDLWRDPVLGVVVGERYFLVVVRDGVVADVVDTGTGTGMRPVWQCSMESGGAVIGLVARDCWARSERARHAWRLLDGRLHQVKESV